jgi:hypothetical protein
MVTPSLLFGPIAPADDFSPVCGLGYRRVDDITEIGSRTDPMEGILKSSLESELHTLETPKEPEIFGPPRPSNKRKRTKEEVADFRHVRLRTQVFDPDEMDLENTSRQESYDASTSFVWPTTAVPRTPSSDENINISRKRQKLNLYKCNPCRVARKKVGITTSYPALVN